MLQTKRNTVYSPLFLKSARMVIFGAALLSAACGGGGSSTSAAPTYYVDATAGADSNNGTTAATAWRSLSRLASATYSSTTTVLLKRGEVWSEPLNLASSNIVIDAYGSGALPKIDGSRVITGWSALGGNLFHATVTLGATEALGNLSANGTMLSFVPWNTDAATTFASASNESFSYAYPNNLYLKTASNPATTSYRASVVLRGIFADGLSNITIRNIEITRVSLNGIEFKNCSTCQVSDSVVTRSGGAVIATSPTTPPDYLYAGNGVDFSNNVSNGRATRVNVSEIFDSCLAVELYESNRLASAMLLSDVQLDRCGFAGVEVSVLRNQSTVNSAINDLTLSGAVITQSGKGWSGRRYGIDGHGIRIVADANAGSMSAISVNSTQVSGSAGDGIFLAGEIGDVTLQRVKARQNDGAGVNVAAASAVSLLLNLRASILDRNGSYGVSYNGPQAAGMRLYHNTYYNNPINLAVFNQAGVADIRNNLYYNDNGGTHVYVASSLINPTLNHNCYNDMANMIGYNGAAYATLAAFRAVHGTFEANGRGDGVVGLTDPANGLFTLQGTSVCQTLGDNTTGVVSDYNGAAFGNPPPSGALAFP